MKRRIVYLIAFDMAPYLDRLYDECYTMYNKYTIGGIYESNRFKAA